MSGKVSFDASKPLVGRITDIEPKQAPASDKTAPKPAQDQLNVGSDRAALSKKISDAFDRREKANGIILARQTQLYVGWNPEKDVAYQQALKDKAAATAEIDKYRQTAPDLVKAEEERRSPTARATSFFKKLWTFFKPVPGPMGLPIPNFVKSFFDKVFRPAAPNVIQA